MDPRAAAASSGSGRPAKGILKNRSGGGISLEGAESGGSLYAAAPPTPPTRLSPGVRRGPPQQPPPEAPDGKKSQKWDEMNILATYHPVGKDYGLMKIDEPSTPYHSMVGDDEDALSDSEGGEALTAEVLAKKLAEGKGPKVLARHQSSSEEEDDEEELTPEELEKKRQFEMKRKRHYNEAQNIKLARQLIEKELRGDAAEEDEEDEEDEEMVDAPNSGQRSPQIVSAPTDPLENAPRS